jgi:predicted permease
MKIALPEALYPRTDQRANFLRQLLEPLNSAPGISVAAVTDRLPLSGETNWGGFNIVGRPVLDSAHAPVVEGRAVSANYFRAVGIPLLRGREFSESEVEQGRRVVVINQAMAAKFWPGRDPIGQQITSPYQPTAPPREVIGVVGNIKDAALDADSPPEMYTLVGWWTVMNLVIRSTVDESALTATVRHAVAALDRGVPVYGVTRMDRLIGESIARQRFEMVLLGLFAVVALVLAAVGIYGLLSFAVDRQTQAIGVRMALGATATNVLSLVVTQGMKLAVAGLAAGALASLWLTQLMRSLLFHISPSDPLTFAGVTLLLLVVAAAASYIPARRAARVDPVVALRYE